MEFGVPTVMTRAHAPRQVTPGRDVAPPHKIRDMLYMMGVVVRPRRDHVRATAELAQELGQLQPFVAAPPQRT